MREPTLSILGAWFEDAGGYQYARAEEGSVHAAGGDHCLQNARSVHVRIKIQSVRSRLVEVPPFVELTPRYGVLLWCLSPHITANCAQELGWRRLRSTHKSLLHARQSRLSCDKWKILFAG